jgi:hypothetical protein
MQNGEPVLPFRHFTVQTFQVFIPWKVFLISRNNSIQIKRPLVILSCFL